MSKNSDKVQDRRRFLTGVGVVATTAALANSASAQQHNDHEMHHGFAPARHDEDAWMDDKQGIHRVFLDSSTGNGGITALNYANNLMFAHEGDYEGGKETDYAIIVCFRHASTAFGYNDAMWAKYGEIFSRVTRFNNRETDSAWKQNPLMIPGTNFASRGNTIQSLPERGDVSFAICSKATMSMSQNLARTLGGDADAYFAELTANNVPNSRYVPAGVIAATRSQEYGFSYLYAG